jgi:TatD DNase family protein
MREAEEDTLAILREAGKGMSGVVHCFSGGPDLALEVAQLGLHLSFSGIVAFPKAEAVREAARAVPDTSLLIETDSPYLSPPPKRGRRNEPARVRLVADTVAALRGVRLDDVARISSRNARQLFGLPLPMGAPIVYAIRDQLYVNLTNECTLRCTFCPKRGDWTVKGHMLRHESDPSEQAVRRAVRGAQPEQYREVVLCGLGEPTIRLELALSLGRELRSKGVRTRLDTDGLASLRERRDVAPEVGEAFDAVSVSLNAPEAQSYARICPSAYGEEAWLAAVDFLRRVRVLVREVTATVVAMPGIDLEACRSLADEIGVAFRVRQHNVVG